RVEEACVRLRLDEVCWTWNEIGETASVDPVPGQICLVVGSPVQGYSAANRDRSEGRWLDRGEVVDRVATVGSRVVEVKRIGGKSLDEERSVWVAAADRVLCRWRDECVALKVAGRDDCQ